MYTNNKSPINLQFPQIPRVLVVDDDADYCNLMMLLLQPYDIEVQTAFSVKQALEVFGQWQPDVLVSDIALPKENGYTLIQQVRTNAGEHGEVILAIATTLYNDKNMF
jgi:two-component system, OmpR family, response regulator